MKSIIKLLIIGAGGHGQSVAEAAELTSKFEVVGFVDDALPLGANVLGYSVLGTAADLSIYASVCEQVLVAIGNNAMRAVVTDRVVQAGLTLATVVHPQAIVSPRAHIEMGSVVMAGAVVGTETQLGLGTIVNCGAVVDHHARVNNFGHLGVGACMAGRSELGAKAWMQAGSSLAYGVILAMGLFCQPSMRLSKLHENKRY